MANQDKRALVVDEEISWCKQLESRLTAQGIAVELRNHLDQGLTEATQGDYDLVLMNDRVLDTSTHKTRLQHLLKASPQQQVFLISDLPDWQRARDAFLLGATGHTTKSKPKLPC